MVDLIFAGRAIALVFLLVGPVADARELLRPAEQPPVSFAGQQYVDSKGCLFLRAGTAADVVWIPRVTRQGASVCGYPPSGRRVSIAGEDGAGNTVTGAEPKTAIPDLATAERAQSGGILVAVGSFSVAANADRAARSMTDLGLPVMRGQVVQSGITLASVFAGPFETRAAATSALQVVRAAGFPDAIIVGR